MFLEEGAIAGTKPLANTSHGFSTSQRNGSKFPKTPNALSKKAQAVTKSVKVSSASTANAAHRQFKAPNRNGNEPLKNKQDDIVGCEPEKTQKSVSRPMPARERNAENTSSIEQGSVVTAAPETGFSQANSTTSRNQTTRDTKPPAPSRKPAKRQPPAEAEPKSQLKQERVLPNTTSGRPQRKAKQTALAKLRSKTIETDDDELAQTDGEPESESSMVLAKKTRNNFTRRMEEGAVELSKSTLLESHSKQKETGLQRGKLRSTKANGSVSKTDAKIEVANACTAPEAGLNSSLRESKGNEPDTRELQASKKAKHTRGSATRSRYLLDRSQPSKRPGALKRPARSASRGRKSVGDQSVYEVSENAVQTTRSKQNFSKALIPHTAKIQPTRQRMQAQSIKKRSPQDSAPQTNSQPPSSEQSVASLYNFIRDGKEGSHPPKGSRVAGPSKSHHSGFQSRQNGDIQNSKPGRSELIEAPLQERAGSSQINAILIHQSDRSGSGSSPRTSTQAQPPPTNASHILCVSGLGERPQTPFAIPSSPPGQAKRSGYTLSVDKPTIIAFGKKGPRNQGTAAVREVVSSKNNLNDDEGRSKTLLIRDATNVSARIPFPACLKDAGDVLPPTQRIQGISNTDADTDDVFNAFLHDGKNTALAKMVERDREPGEYNHRSDAADKEDVGLLGLTEDFEGPTLVEEDGDDTYTHKLRTASELRCRHREGPD